MSYVFDPDAFRVSYPEFANTTAFPDAKLQRFWTTAGMYLGTEDYGDLNGDERYTALTLMTAHLLEISILIANGQTPGVEQAATVDKVSVTLTPPPLDSQWQWWLQTTVYGQQLLALLQVSSCGGMYIGGSPERAAFRGVCGGF